MFLQFTNTDVSSNNKSLSLSDIPLLFYHPLLFLGKNVYSSYLFWRMNKNFKPHPL